MNTCSFGSIISTTFASGSAPLRLAETITRTLSPLRGVHRVAFGHENLLFVHHHGIASVAAAHEDSRVLRASVCLGLVFSERHLGYLVGLGQEVEYVYDVDAVGRVCCPDSEGYLFVVESLLVPERKEFYYFVADFVLAKPRRRFLLLGHMWFVIDVSG